MVTDNSYMARATALAKKGMGTVSPNPRVGCVIVKDGVIIGEGYHAKAGQCHAEVLALRQAGESATNSTLYVTLEPCSHHGKTPPCAETLISAGVAKVVVAMNDPNPLVSGRGIEKLKQANIEVVTGVLKTQAEQLNPGFIKRMLTGYPWVVCKMAMSIDGRTAMKSGESQWITGAAAREDVHKLRARCCAVLTGSGTILADNPSLTARFSKSDSLSDITQPLRVIIDTHLATPPESKILNQDGQAVIYHNSDSEECSAALADTGAELIRAGNCSGRVDLHSVLKDLASKGINEVMVEAGATLAGQLFEDELIDEFRFYMASLIMGNSARALFHLPNISRMNQKKSIVIQDIRAIGSDWKITALPEYKT